jgi:hypothetical protein
MTIVKTNGKLGRPGKGNHTLGKMKMLVSYNIETANAMWLKERVLNSRVASASSVVNFLISQLREGRITCQELSE